MSAKIVVQTCNVQQNRQRIRELNKLHVICLLPQPLNSFQGAEHFTERGPYSCPYGLQSLLS